MNAHQEASSDNADIPASGRVRLKGDPTRIGIATGKTKPARRGGGVRVQVTFPDATSWIPGDQLECMPSNAESPIDLLQSGKLGKAIDFRRTLMHMRLTGRLADVIYSMEATNTDFYPYQFKPVLRFLMSPTNAMLIADEVGLGKTIEAGLIWTELKSRFDYRRLLVLCPAVLREKWQRELAGKMGVGAEIVDAKKLVQRLSEPASKLNGFALICSLQGARPQRDWQYTENPSGPAELARLFRAKEQEDPMVDLLIIDEAHYLRNPESQTNELGQMARQITENLLLLSATPIHNYNRDLFSLLQLLDPDTFERLEDLSLILEVSRPLVEARDAILRQSPSRQEAIELVDRANRHQLLRGNRQLAVVKQVLSDESVLQDRDRRAHLARQLETVNPLAYLITRTRKRDVKEWRVIRDPVAEKVSMNGHEAEFYRAVTDQVIKYAMSQDANMRFLLATPQRQMSSSMAATLRAWQRRSDNFSEDTSSDSSDEKVGPLTLDLISKADHLGDVEKLTANDSKYNRVAEHLKEYFADFPDEKVVLFSTFRATLTYLGERLANDGIPNIVLHGAVKEPKDTLLQRFEAEPDIRILLSSEVGSEGVDLQFCRLLINYDLPWNPMRIEQRIGRLDRLGQNADKILIWNLFYDDTIDSRIYERLYEKLNLCREALGDFESVLGDEIRKLTTDLLSGQLSNADQEHRIDQTTQALANLKHENENLESEASHLVAYGDYILNEVRAAHEMNRWITGEDLESYVTDFLSLNYTGCSFRLNEKKGLFEVRLSNEAKQELSQFVKEQRLPSTRLTQNSDRPIECQFENRMAISPLGPVETITQFHPVVRFVSKSIEQSETQLRPAVSLKLSRELADESLASGDHVLCVSRWSIEGLQAVEKLAFAAAQVEGSVTILDETQSEVLSSDCSKHAVDWFEAKNSLDLGSLVEIADDKLFGRLEERFEEYVDDVRRKNEDRADLQLRTLETHLKNQERKLERVRETHVQNNRESLVKATDGRIAALRNRIERKRLEVNNRREILYRNDEVLVALIRIG